MGHSPAVDISLVFVVAAACAIPATVYLVLRFMPTGSPRELALREVELKEKALALDMKKLELDREKIGLAERELRMREEDAALKAEASRLQLHIKKMEFEQFGPGGKRTTLSRAALNGARG